MVQTLYEMFISAPASADNKTTRQPIAGDGIPQHDDRTRARTHTHTHTHIASQTALAETDVPCLTNMFRALPKLVSTLFLLGVSTWWAGCGGERGKIILPSEEALGEGAGLSLTECMRSFDGQSSCGVNDTVFIYNAAAKKGAAFTVGSGNSSIEFHRCLIHNSTTGWPFEDDPQGEGGGFALGAGTTTILEDCVVTDNYCGKKVWYRSWW